MMGFCEGLNKAWMARSSRAATIIDNRNNFNKIEKLVLANYLPFVMAALDAAIHAFL
jgi:hypothetical protein